MSAQQRIEHLHSFRGVAIITIVAAHAWSFAIFWTGQLDDSLEWVFAVTEMLFHGSTLFFAIISGLLFTQVLHRKPWSHFYRQKLTKVVLPYIVMSAVMTAMYWQYVSADNPDANMLHVYLNSLLVGKASIQYWYIPVLVVLFALTPLFQWLLNKLSTQPRGIVVAFALTLLPLIITRSPFPDFIKPQTFVYFSGAYLLGMIIGSHYKATLTLIKRYQLPILAIVVISSLALVYGYLVDTWSYGFFSLRESLYYLQKCLLALLILHWLHGWHQPSHQQSNQTPKQLARRQAKPKTKRLLSLCADHAFAIYFIHVVPMGWLIGLAWQTLADHRSPWLIVSFGLASLTLSITLSIVISRIIRLLFKQHSSKLIGA
ncbi:acyltransferase [Shewanella sp. WXL01]|uniref:acyltransferase n=1 Tax=Shewanella sp. WXL01 TaxID=2709721 RepID=UPI0014384065|nr:acyltransferase [Shewanella sp. WXL01]NKF52076.1 acyltransferase [Shewanella sp. WXL01]